MVVMVVRFWHLASGELLLRLSDLAMAFTVQPAKRENLERFLEKMSENCHKRCRSIRNRFLSSVHTA